MPVLRGRNFLQTPGPTNIPDRVLNAMHRPAMEFSGPEFIELSRSCFTDLAPLYRHEGEVFIYAANGHGAWEAALVNTLSPGDRILVPHTGNFSASWQLMAERHGLIASEIPNDWRQAVDPAAVEEILRADKGHEIKAVLLVHTDTATGITCDVPAVRRAIDAAGHPALFMVDTIASFLTVDVRMDEWGIDVAVGAGQKGLMMPPGLSFNAVSEKALKAAEQATLPRAYWNWADRMERANYRWFCGTAPEHLVFALREAIDMVNEEGLEAIFARHARLSGAVHRAVEAWSKAGVLEFNALIPEQRAASVTTIRVAEGTDVEALHVLCRERFNVALGYGLGELSGRAFRIGHMGDLNEPMILGTLGVVETALKVCGVPHGDDGLGAAVRHLAEATERARAS
ncbi:MAG TPA: aminotransferase class V-fold PLP-dependent enzyme [Alphaproteobacteria bacterium]|nr:aminotransferase class V-fold PLP-dependent enzyme [Alphaproteobacteria bacterium]